ncbi:class I SAM-dependent methyltransferase [Mucilaginibacter sp. McL0603]|uniref:class I SAM-dependent methyltransferase n=1 Tax=Mucilaginibacter sp. McL0603 TaxID=3415670 RepID=UPI003CF57C82
MKSRIINYNLAAEKAIFEMQSDIGAIENDPLLFEEKNFDQRTEAIDFIEFQIIDQIEGLLGETNQSDKLLLLKHRAEKVKSELEKINIILFRKLQKDIRNVGYTGKEFKSLVNKHVDFNLDDNEHQEEPGYDNLDIFINGLLSPKTMPEQTKDLEPEMVFYQKTPARIIFELADKIKFAKEDVFFDLGSGLGQAGILVNLLTGVTAKGVEFEPAFCDYSQDCVKKLNLSHITFINADARQADYSDGTIFFMYTPFNGEILQEVLEILRKESLLRKIKIITYGPCTPKIASQSWLDSAVSKDDNIYKLAVFTSLQN